MTTASFPRLHEELASMVEYTRRGNAITLEHIARLERGGTGRDRR